MSLSDKIMDNPVLDINNEGLKIVHVEDVQGAVKELKEAVLRNIDVWSNMTEEQVKSQLDYLWEQYFGEKLI